jgi:protein gp37
MSTKIEWCDETINPIVGCTKISEGCKNCYAEKMAKRLKGMQLYQYQNIVDKNGWTGKISFVPSELEKPYKWKKPKKIFIGSMGDLFHKNRDINDMRTIFLTIKNNPHHIFIVLTKRPEGMRDYFSWHIQLKNLWLGVSVSTQKMADEYIPILMQTPAVVRFISAEPMLEPLDLNLDNEPSPDWIICGRETGIGARPFYPEWAEDLHKQCEHAAVPFFLKNMTLDRKEYKQFPAIGGDYER